MTDICIRKSAHETYSGTIMHDDSELSFPTKAHQVWAFEFVAFMEGDRTGDAKLTITAPVDAEGHFGVTALGLSANTNQGNVALSSTSHFGAVFTNLGMAGIGIPVICTVKGIVTNGPTDGNVTLQWAQNAIGVTPLKMFAHSHVLASLVA